LSCSWQDLKDFGRKAGDIIYADIEKNGEGIIDYSNKEDMENALRVLPETEFKNRYDRATVRVRRADSDDKISRSRSRDRRGSRSRIVDRGSRARDRSVSRSNSRRKSVPRSPSGVQLKRAKLNHLKGLRYFDFQRIVS
jgi:hypothetical protein